jgi:uncharacterized protein (DUF433 family)
MRPTNAAVVGRTTAMAPASACRAGQNMATTLQSGRIMRRDPEGGAMSAKTEKQYRHLEPRPGSNYRQFFLKGRRIRAAVVDEVIHGPDPRSAEEFAREYQVPLEAVLEALEYVAANRTLIEQERDHEAARLRARGLLGPAQG